MFSCMGAMNFFSCMQVEPSSNEIRTHSVLPSACKSLLHECSLREEWRRERERINASVGAGGGPPHVHSSASKGSGLSQSKPAASSPALSSSKLLDKMRAMQQVRSCSDLIRRCKLFLPMKSIRSCDRALHPFFVRSRTRSASIRREAVRGPPLPPPPRSPRQRHPSTPIAATMHRHPPPSLRLMPPRD